MHAFARRVRQNSAALFQKTRAVFRAYLPNESQHLFALTLAVGVICGLVAVAFHVSMQAAEHLLIDRAMNTSGPSWIAWTIASPTLGGLLAGALLTWVVPGARGSGIPQVKQAYAYEGGRVRFRDAVGKFFIGAMQIGSGASLGREGPTVQICAGATSMLARLTSLPPKSARRLTPVAVAAGIAAAFNAPIAAVTFTIEEIVGSLDQTVLSGVVIAAALAAVIERSVLGAHPVIEVDQPYALDHPTSLVFYAALGLAAAGVSIAFTDGLLKLRLWFRGFKLVPAWAHPAVGGLVTGVLAVLTLHFLGARGVTGGGYQTLGQALAGGLALKVLLVLCVVKGVATVFSYSSGGAGGIFAPALFVGAMLGGAVGFLDVAALHHEQRQLGAFALVGMGAVFAGVIRAPITSVLIIFEMTGGYGLVLPLMLANMTSYALTRRWRPTPVYDALLEQDGVLLPHTTPRVNPLEQLTASDAMSAPVVSVRARQTVVEALEVVRDAKFALLPVLDEAGGLVGVVRLARLRSAATTGDAGSPVAALVEAAHTVLADAPLIRSVVRMNEAGVRQSVVLDNAESTRPVGVLAISDFVRAHARTVPPPADSAAARAVSHSPAPSLSLRAHELMATAHLVSRATGLEALIEELHQSAAKALVVDGGEAGDSVVFLEEVRDFGHDDQLQSVLIAADVARTVPVVHPDAEFSDLVQQFSGGGPDAVLVKEPGARTPQGIITRAAVAAVLLDWYAAELRTAPARRASGRKPHPS
ncbi:MAG: chloride channel protein [Myxococcaceae bacterium]